jgi:hypothetical protein
MSDEQQYVSAEAVEARRKAEDLRKTAVRQLMQAVRIRKGTEEVRRVNGIAAAISQRLSQ